LKNKNPIPETSLNIHQLANTMAYMEQVMLVQETKIAYLEAELFRIQDQGYNNSFHRINSITPLSREPSIDMLNDETFHSDELNTGFYQD
jgi:hypothetical protein